MESSNPPIHRGPPDRSPPYSNVSVKPAIAPPTITITEASSTGLVSPRSAFTSTTTMPSSQIWVQPRGSETMAPKLSDKLSTDDTSSETSSNRLLEVNTDPRSLQDSLLTSQNAVTSLMLPPRWSWEPSRHGHALFLCSAIPQWLIMSETHPFSSAFIDLPDCQSTAPVGILPNGCSAIMLPSGRVVFRDNPPAQNSQVTNKDPLQERYTNLDPRTGQVGQSLRKWSQHNNLTLFDYGQTQFHENSIDRTAIAPLDGTA